jgi:hypothetical protein
VNQSQASFALALLLATSLAIKSYVSMSGRVLAAQPDDSDIAAMLAANGFEMTVPMPATDPAWFLGETGDCRIYIAGISPQGWHRAAVEWKAQSVNGQVSYLTENEMTGQQPVLRTTLIHYWRRLQRNVGIDAAPLRLRAIVASGDCNKAMAAFAGEHSR